MMIILRCLLVIIGFLGGAIIFRETPKLQDFTLIGGCMGSLTAILIILVEQRVKNVTLKTVVGGVLGLIIGLINGTCVRKIGLDNETFFQRNKHPIYPENFGNWGKTGC